MRAIAFLSSVAVIVVSGCGATARPNNLVVHTVSATEVRIDLRSGADRLKESQMMALAERLKVLGATLRQGQRLTVVLAAEDGVFYEDDARVILECHRAKIERLTLAGISIHVPKVFPPPIPGITAPLNPQGTHARAGDVGKGKAERIRVELLDVSANGDYSDAGGNDYVRIGLNGKALPLRAGKSLKVMQEIERSFQELTSQLRANQDAGVAESTLVEIMPTMDCRHRWVVRACKAVLAAGFANIELAFPYN